MSSITMLLDFATSLNFKVLSLLRSIYILLVLGQINTTLYKRTITIECARLLISEHGRCIAPIDLRLPLLARSHPACCSPSWNPKIFSGWEPGGHKPENLPARNTSNHKDTHRLWLSPKTPVAKKIGNRHIKKIFSPTVTFTFYMDSVRKSGFS